MLFNVVIVGVNPLAFLEGVELWQNLWRGGSLVAKVPHPPKEWAIHRAVAALPLLVDE